MANKFALGRTKIGVVAIAAAIGIFSASSASAGGFYLSLGPIGSQIRVTNDSRSGSSDYKGPGYMLDARLRVQAAAGFGIDIVGSWAQSFTNSDAPFIDQTGRLNSFGGGIDVLIYNFFLGTKYQRHSMIIKNVPRQTGYDLYYNTVGVDAGLKFNLGTSMSLMLGAQYNPGSAAPGDSGIGGSNRNPTPQTVREVSVFALINVLIFGSGEKAAIQQ